MAKQTIDVGTVANDGTGDQLRAAFIKTNDNTDEIYAGTASVVRQTAPDTATGPLEGVSGDIAGMIATDGTDVWVCRLTWTAPGQAVWIKLPNNAETVEINDLSAAVTWANVPDANVTETSVTQHQAAILAGPVATDGTAAYAITAANEAGMIVMSSGSANVVTIPDNAVIAMLVGTQIDVVSTGAGVTSIAITTDAINGVAGPLAMTAGTYSAVKLTKITATTWIATGDLA